MPPTDAERRFLEGWRIAGPILENMRTERLRAMTKEEGRIVAERVMEAVPVWSVDTTEEASSGLIEQQRWFQLARERQ